MIFIMSYEYMTMNNNTEVQDKECLVFKNVKLFEHTGIISFADFNDIQTLPIVNSSGFSPVLPNGTM